MLKGCERLFRPTHPQARYCSPECRAEARRWRQRRASRQYQQTPKGREKRQAQSQRYRCRCAERRQAAAAHAQETLPTVPDTACACPTLGCEGQRPAHRADFFCCDRPGCYEHFAPSRRSPCQRFCSAACRQALRRVIERERLWRKRSLQVRHQHRCGTARRP
ncbi:MAG: hypothetical protein ABSH35_34180 [Isosphaeraceae bacterium]